jgi:hypothetical protein
MMGKQSVSPQPAVAQASGGAAGPRAGGSLLEPLHAATASGQGLRPVLKWVGSGRDPK